jgi:hypothetical protein
MYQYEKEKSAIFTEEGQKNFLAIRDHVLKLLDEAGACNMNKAAFGADVTGCTWFMMACVDRLVELGEIKEVLRDNIAGQYRIFVKPKE